MHIECGAQLELSLCSGQYELIKKMSEGIERGTIFMDTLITPMLDPFQTLIITDVNLMATLCTEEYEVKVTCVVIDIDRRKHIQETIDRLLDTTN